MALALSVNLNDYVRVDGKKVEVIEVIDNSRCRVKVHGEAMDHVFLISDEQTTEIMPDVRVSTGLRGKPHTAHLLIDAPRRITILRSSLDNA